MSLMASKINNIYLTIVRQTLIQKQSAQQLPIVAINHLLLKLRNMIPNLIFTYSPNYNFLVPPRTTLKSLISSKWNKSAPIKTIGESGSPKANRERREDSAVSKTRKATKIMKNNWKKPTNKETQWKISFMYSALLYFVLRLYNSSKSYLLCFKKQ